MTSAPSRYTATPIAVHDRGGEPAGTTTCVSGSVAEARGSSSMPDTAVRQNR